MKSVRNLAFLVLVFALFSSRGLIRAQECEEEPSRQDYFDGYNFSGGSYSSASANNAACASYCDSWPNAGGGYCTSVAGTEFGSLGGCPAEGYCQCGGCVF